MGEPVFDPEKIPVDIRRKLGEELKTQKSKPVIDYPLQIDDREFKITCVSMGNPHAVIVVDNVSEYPVAYYGPIIENHQLFPKRTNVEFVEVLSPAEITMRVWERGAGETMACGTGASASAVAAHLKGLTERDVSVRLTGGALRIEWAGDGRVYMTGPAVEVFTGELDLQSGMMPGP
jgi:diaminopimelate epimerase